MNASVYAEEFDQQGFDPDDFTERLVWRITNGQDMDAMELHRHFEEEIQNMQLLSDQCQSKINRLQNQCREEEEDFYMTLEKLELENKKTVDQLETLEGRISKVSHKVLHLGEQLQAVNEPRSRAFEALQLMRYFNEFLNGQAHESDVFRDPDRILEAGEIIQKLHVIAQELPSSKFRKAQDLIQFKYNELEGVLLEDFVRYHRVKNVHKMKLIAEVLVQFKGYSQCLDVFVEECQAGAFRRPDIFADILTLFEDTAQLAGEVFPQPDAVMAKLVLNIFQGKLQEYLQAQLQDKNDDGYLNTLLNVYLKTQSLLASLSKFSISNDKEYLETLVNHLFGRHLQDYITRETNNLRSRCEEILRKYYESIGFSWSGPSSGGLSELKRDLQSRMMSELPEGRTIISEEVAVNVLEETKNAFLRCENLSKRDSVCPNMERLLDILLKYLYREHVERAAELATARLNDPKSGNVAFLALVRQANTITHLFEKQFEDRVVTVVRHDTASEDSCKSKKRLVLRDVESKLSHGLEKLITLLIRHVKSLLSEQKRVDFRPEGDSMALHCSNACKSVCKYLREQVTLVRDTLDAQNLERALCELGVAFHRTLIDHIHQFTYNDMGVLLLLQDVKEYSEIVKLVGIPLVTRLFDTLSHLCKLLQVMPENLQRISETAPLNDLDRGIITSFIQLRDDYRTISSKMYESTSNVYLD